MTEPTVTAFSTRPVRTYNLRFDRRYVAPVVPPQPPPPPEQPGIVTPPVSGAENLVPVIWDGLALQANEDAGTDVWFTAVVELVTGWYASPPLDGRDVERALADGSVWGNKLLRAREVTITGAVVGPRRRIIGFRDQLAARAAGRRPAELVIGDPQLGTSLTAMVRADTESLTHEFFAGPTAYRYQVTVTAADPLLFDRDWQHAVLTTATAAEAGRAYERRYDTPPAWSAATGGWGYESPYPAGSAAYITNAGNAPAPVYATYDGDLDDSRLTDETTSILMDPLAAGVRLFVATATLATEGPGGASRAQWIRPGSRPMWIPANSTARWHLYSQGSGRVTLSWRSSWA